ncbi:MAG TPA: alpha-2-macroglobulin family protein, partial [Leptospiraceae bacterium]|nr:alpha-2-macroglobulin family protein [Leptospiraceae bacterium]
MKFALFCILFTFGLNLQAADKKKLKQENASGYILDKKTKQPVSGVTVELKNANFGIGYYRARTDKTGKFEFKDIIRGVDYILAVTAKGYVNKNLLNYKLDTKKVFIEKDITIFGRVLDTSDKPLSKTEIKIEKSYEYDYENPDPETAPEAAAENQGDPQVNMEQLDYPKSAVTDEQGNYKISKLPKGSYNLTFYREGYIVETASIKKVESGKSFRLAMIMTRPSSISGKVLIKDVLPETGAKNIMITLNSPVKTYNAYSYHDGTFQIQDIKPGKYALSFTHRGFHDIRIKDLEIREGQVLTGQNKIIQAKDPSLTLYSSNYTYPAGNKVSFNLRSYRIDKVDLKIYQVPASHLVLPPAKPEKIDPDKFGYKVVQKWEEPIPRYQPYDWMYTDISPKEPLPLGTYCFEASYTDNIIERKFFTVTSTGIIAKRSESGFLIYATDLITNKPLENASVYVFLNETLLQEKKAKMAVPSTKNTGTAGTEDPDAVQDYSSYNAEYEQVKAVVSKKDLNQFLGFNAKQILEGKTDQDGVFRINHSSAEALYVYVVSPNTSSAILNTGNPLSYTSEINKYFIYTDRPTYRTGHTVYYKVIAKTRNDKFVPHAPEKFSIFMHEQTTGKEYAAGEVTLDDWGTAKGSYTLREDAELGRYEVVLKKERIGNSGEKSWELAGSGSYYVEQYRKPEFKVVITPVKDYYINGDKVEFKVEGKYLFGAPVAKGHIEYKILETKYNVVENKYFWEEDYTQDYGGGSRILREGTAVLDENGIALIQTDSGTYPYDRNISLEVSLKDKSNVVMDASQSVMVGRGEYYIMINTKQAFFDKNDKKRIEIKTVDLNYNPVSTEVSVKFHRFIWKPWQRLYVREEKSVFETKVQTNAEGKAELVLDTEINFPGELDVVATATDRRKNKINANRVVWIYDQTVPVQAQYKNLELVPERKTLEKGEEVSVMIKSRYTDVPVLLTLEGKEVYEHKLIWMKSNVMTVKMNIKDAYAPNLFVSAVLQRNKALFTASEELELPYKDTKIKWKITPDKDKYMPGDTVKLKVKAEKEDGKPADADFSLAVVDESIFLIRPDTTPSMNPFFYTKISNWVSTTHSFPITLLAGPGKDAGDPSAVRKDFKDTAYWNASVRTGASGESSLEFKIPDNLTTWRITVRGHDREGRVGELKEEILSTKDIVARFGKPRYFTEGDHPTVIAIVTNNSKRGMEKIALKLKTNGNELGGMGVRLSLPPNGTGNKYYSINIPRDSEKMKLYLEAKEASDSDALEETVPVHPAGNPFKTALSGDFDENKTAELKDKRLAELNVRSAEIHLHPSNAEKLISAFKVLRKYEYSCTEQTLSKHLPGWKLKKTFDAKNASDRFDVENTEKSAQEAIDIVLNSQNTDGTWGFWYGDEGNEMLTGYVLESIYNAYPEGVPADIIARLQTSFAALDRMLTNPQSTDKNIKSYIIYIASLYDRFNLPVFEQEMNQQNQNAYQKANMISALKRWKVFLQKNPDLEGKSPADFAMSRIDEKMKTLSEKIKTQKKSDAKGVYFEIPNQKSWQWLGSRTEVSARVLSSLLDAGEKSSLTAELYQSLLKRQSTESWMSTKETASVINAAADYLRTKGIPKPAKGKVQFKFSTNDPSAVFDLDSGEKQTLVQNIKLKKKTSSFKVKAEGEANSEMSYNVFLKGDLEIDEKYRPETKGLEVERKFYSVKRVKDIKGSDYLVPEPASVSESLKVGQEIMVKLRFTGTEDFENIALEDYLPSGFEVVNLDIYSAGDYSYSQRQDERVVYFFNKIQKGKTYEIAYM